jgi:hypothetical protein
MMRRRPTLSEIALVIGLSITVVILPSCRRAPEEAEPLPPPQPPSESIEALELPQANQQIGISLDSLPEGLAATFNSQYWVRLVDVNNPSIKYALIGVPPVLPGPTPVTVREFVARVKASPDGRILDQGTVETVLGEAEWVIGVYVDDDGVVEDIHVFVPLPSGDGRMVVTSLCPPGIATLESRLKVIRELLTHVT